MEIKEDLKRVTIRIPDELHAWLSSCAKKESTSINSLVIRKLRENMENPNEEDAISESDFLPAVLEIEKQVKKLKNASLAQAEDSKSKNNLNDDEAKLLGLFDGLSKKQKQTIAKSITSIISDFS